MATIVKLLEEEMKASRQYTQRNFGLKTGDGFRELVEEVLSSESFSMSLILDLLMGAISGKEFAETLSGNKASPPLPAVRKAILEHLDVFELRFELLYWGIQVGRKLQREEDALLSTEEGRGGNQDPH